MSVSVLTRQPLTLGENHFPADTLFAPVIQSVHRQLDLYALESFRPERFLHPRQLAPPCAPVAPIDIEVVRVWGRTGPFLRLARELIHIQRGTTDSNTHPRQFRFCCGARFTVADDSLQDGWELPGPFRRIAPRPSS
jgi:hypothetical protein